MAGLVRKRTDPRDGRRLLLSLSNKGRLFDVETEGTIEAAIQRALDRAPSDQIEGARALLASVVKTLNDLEATPASDPAGDGAQYG